MRLAISGATVVAGVVGAPVRHSLSPLIHNAWLSAAGLDGVYIPIELARDRFDAFILGCRGGSIRGLNVTLPFKTRALELADAADAAAQAAGAANLLLFSASGGIEARNTDGIGLLSALAEQAPGLRVQDRPAAVIGAGGAARGAVAALLAAGASHVRSLNRTLDRARALAGAFAGGVQAFGLEESSEALDGVGLIVNATSAGLDGGGSPDVTLDHAPTDAVVMDMVYTPLQTAFLKRAAALGLHGVDGLAMLIGQARPSFQALYGHEPPVDVDVRGLALGVMGEAG